MTGAKEITINFLALQAGQQAHDKLRGRRVGSGGWPEFRRDAVISFDARVSEAYAAQPEQLPSAVAAVFAATLRLANSLNFDLRHALPLNPTPSSTASSEALLRAFAPALGDLNKAADAADHGEDFPIVPTYKAGVVSAVHACMAAATAHNFDLPLELVRHWQRTRPAESLSASLF